VLGAGYRENPNIEERRTTDSRQRTAENRLNTVVNHQYSAVGGRLTAVRTRHQALSTRHRTMGKSETNHDRLFDTVRLRQGYGGTRMTRIWTRAEAQSRREQKKISAETIPMNRDSSGPAVSPGCEKRFFLSVSAGNRFFLNGSRAGTQGRREDENRDK
jgi:hypothetical protein